MDERTIARVLAAGRVAIGLGLFLVPERAAAAWLGPAARDRDVAPAVRAFGVRDVVLGVGALAALRHLDDGAADVHRWVEAGIVADLGDVAATALAGRIDVRRGAVLATALSGAALGGYLRTRLR